MAIIKSVASECSQQKQKRGGGNGRGVLGRGRGPEARLASAGHIFEKETT